MKRSVQFLALFSSIVAATTAMAHGPTNLDVRARLPAVVSQGAANPVTRAATLAGGEVASIDEATGRPTFLWAVGSVPGLVGVGSEAAARDHVARFQASYGLSRSALRAARAVRVHDTGRGGILVTLRQSVDGIELLHSDAKVLMRRNLDLVAISGSLHPAASLKLRPSARTFTNPPEQALAQAFVDLFGVQVREGDFKAKKGKDEGGYVRFDLAETRAVRAADLVFTEPARVKKVFFPLGDEIVPAYFVEVYAGKGASTTSEYYRYVIGARDGRMLQRQDLTVHADFRVWADPVDLRPTDGPHTDFTPHPTGLPDGSEPAFTAPVLVSTNGFNSFNGGPPDPWVVFPQSIATFGNNVDAYSDHGFPDGFSNGDLRAEMTGPNIFDHTYDTTQDPLAGVSQTMAATVQLFYVNNWLHDYFYDSGFNEFAGNAQVSNMGRGGLGGDVLRAEAQDSALDWSEVLGGPQQLNNANMSVPADGVSPRMQMFLWSGRQSLSLVANPGGPLVSAGAEFGAPQYDLTASAVLGDDGVDPVSNGCEPFVNDLTGAIALVDRGACPFVQKAFNAEQAGAVGIVIANNQPGAAPFLMGIGGPEVVNIPSMMITLEEGAALKTALGSGSVSLRMTRAIEARRDGDLDNMIVAHEWGHYLHFRLATGGNQMMGAESEGWADFIALHMALREGDDLDATYAAGIYGPAALGDSGYFGIRRFPYSVDPTKNALSFRHIADGAPLPQSPINAIFAGNPNSEVHSAGEVWASMMFEAYIAMLKQTEGPNPPYDFDEARRRMADYVVAGMQLAPDSATFTEARDGVLAAALAADPADAVLIAQAFASRGAGSCAESPPRFSVNLVEVAESNELAPKAVIGAITVDDSAVPCDSDGYLDGEEIGVVSVDLSNASLADLAGATVRIDTSTPGVWFPNGNTVVVPTLGAFEATTAQIDIALDDSFTVVSALDLTVEVLAPGSCADSTTATSAHTVHVDFVDAVSATENAESGRPVWAETGPYADLIWNRAATSPTDHYWLGVDAGATTDTAFESPDLEVSSADPFVVTFDHVYEFEGGAGTFYDGGVLEISDDAGVTWSDISAFVDPGYTGALFGGSGNPLGGRMAFTERNPSFPAPDTVTLDLGSAFAGQTVRFRFRIGTDAGGGAFGWALDDIAFAGIENTPFGAAVPHAYACQSAPIADAGPDQTVEGGTQVILDGSASSDPDGDELTISWSQVGGNPVDIFPGQGGLAAIVAPIVGEDLSLTFLVSVDDGVATSVDTMNVLVLAAPDGTGGGGSGGGPGSGGAGGSGEGGTGGASSTTATTGASGTSTATTGGPATTGVGGGMNQGGGGGDSAVAASGEGCSCRAVGDDRSTSPTGGLAAAVLGLVAAARRRRSDRR